MKRVAILQTGVNNPKMSASYPDYPGMFRSLIGQAQSTPMIELISFPILEGFVLICCLTVRIRPAIIFT